MQRIDRFVPEGYLPKWWSPRDIRQSRAFANTPADSTAAMVSRHFSPGFDGSVRVIHPVEFYVIAATARHARDAVLEQIAAQLDRIAMRCMERHARDHEHAVVGVTHRYHRDVREAVTDRLPEDLRVGEPYLGGIYSVTTFDDRDDVRFALQPDVVVDEDAIRSLQGV